MARSILDNISIILHKPKYGANVGAAVRAALNMGVSRLLVVENGDLEREEVARCATHNAEQMVAAIEYHDNLEQALADFSIVVGTTARHGRMRQISVLPRQISSQISQCLAEGGRVGLLFGPENTGLSNDELKYCGLVCTIPTSGFSSINLAQAVAIICYEVFVGLSSRSFEDVPQKARHATVAEMEPMHSAAQELCAKLDELSGKQLAKHRLHALRQLLARASVSAKEAKLIKDACRGLLQRIGN